MAIISETVRETLISVVGRVRKNKATLAYGRICELAEVSRRNLDDAVPFIARARKVDNPDRVQCVAQNKQTIGPVPVYKCDGCPLLDGKTCLAGQLVQLGKPTDTRELGAPRYTQATASKRHASG
jgi:hypothetical protein